MRHKFFNSYLDSHHSNGIWIFLFCQRRPSTVDVEDTALSMVDINQTALFQSVNSPCVDNVCPRPFYSLFHHALLQALFLRMDSNGLSLNQIKSDSHLSLSALTIIAFFAWEYFFRKFFDRSQFWLLFNFWHLP